MFNSDTKIPIIVVVGPTASGKTKLAVKLAKEYDGEVISADSMQIYKGMSIGTAKPTIDEMEGIPHHLIDFVECSQNFSVADFVRLANSAADDIISRGKKIILAGGTGLYVNSFIDNISFDEAETSTEYRKYLQKIAEEKGNEFLLSELMKIDPEYAKNLHANNLGRIIRALELYKITGISMSEQLINSRKIPSRFAPCMIGLNYADRQKLYDRINLRVDIMVQNCLIDEAHEIYNQSQQKTAHQAIGYKELYSYFNGEKQLDEALEMLKMSTRRYAKRQLTWFRRDERINWIYPDLEGSFENIFEKAKIIVEKYSIL